MNKGRYVAKQAAHIAIWASRLFWSQPCRAIGQEGPTYLPHIRLFTVSSVEETLATLPSTTSRAGFTCKILEIDSTKQYRPRENEAGSPCLNLAALSYLEILKTFTHSTPSDIIAQIATFVLRFIWIFHMQYVGKPERIRSKATESPMNIINSTCSSSLRQRLTSLPLSNP